MSKIHDLSESFALSSANEVKSICKTLFENFDIIYFDYFRSYNDGSRILLCSSSDWSSYLYQQKYWCTDNFNIVVPSEINSYLWSDIYKRMPKNEATLFETKHRDASSYFNIANGVAIADKQDNYVDYYNFGTSPQSNMLLDIFLYDIDILKRFILYFREKANPLFKEALKNIVVPSPNMSDLNEQKQRIIQPNLETHKKTSYLKRQLIASIFLTTKLT